MPLRDRFGREHCFSMCLCHLSLVRLASCQPGSVKPDERPDHADSSRQLVVIVVLAPTIHLTRKRPPCKNVTSTSFGSRYRRQRRRVAQLSRCNLSGERVLLSYPRVGSSQRHSDWRRLSRERHRTRAALDWMAHPFRPESGN